MNSTAYVPEILLILLQQSNINLYIPVYQRLIEEILVDVYHKQLVGGSGKKTTHFIVHVYYYLNHRTLDYLCHKWYNPAPLNGSAPNLLQSTWQALKQL